MTPIGCYITIENDQLEVWQDFYKVFDGKISNKFYKNDNRNKECITHEYINPATNLI